MIYLARLKAATSANTVTVRTDKTDRSPFVSSVSTQSGHISELIEAPSAQSDELRELIALILATDSEADRAEAQAVALADPDAALTSLRLLAADLETAPPDLDKDDRRRCIDCANLTARDKRCLAAWCGEGPGNAARDYHPVFDVPRTCECYSAKAADIDQRTGADRWPYQIADMFPQQRGAQHGD